MNREINDLYKQSSMQIILEKSCSLFLAWNFSLTHSVHKLRSSFVNSKLEH